MHEIRQAIRFLWTHKSFTATGVLTLAIGLGALTLAVWLGQRRVSPADLRTE